LQEGASRVQVKGGLVSKADEARTFGRPRFHH
jgi:hypothetical protein